MRFVSGHRRDISRDENQSKGCLPTSKFLFLSFNFKRVLDTGSQLSVELPDGRADHDVCVLMWWTCTMSPDVVLSCAPFWAHPEGRKQAWRDHWMQAVYYPRNTSGRYLSCCRDEYSFWFDITDTKGSASETLPSKF